MAGIGPQAAGESRTLMGVCVVDRGVSPRRLASFVSRLSWLVVIAAVSACAIKPRQGDGRWQSVEGRAPADVDSFRVSGRLAVSDGRDGGSAGFLWTQRGDRFDVELRQPVSQRTWRLHGDDRGAVLEGADDGPRRADSAEALLREVLGWHVPVRSLRDWVRGLVADNLPVDHQAVDQHGRLVAIEQDGWRVEYRDWLGDGAWPARITARQTPYSVRLVIKDWAIEP